MNCDDTISWDQIVGSVIRLSSTDPLCAAIAINEVAVADPQGCEPLPLLTQFALAWDSDAINTAQDPFGNDQLTCADANIPLAQMAMSAVYITQEGRTIATSEVDDDPSCDRDCEEVGISTEEMIKRTFVRVDDTYLVQVVTVSDFDPLDCDTNFYGAETLVRAALQPLSDGSYAWRVTS